MAKTINPERTGPGTCRECGRRAEKRLNGWCRPCYDRMRRNNDDPFARSAVEQKALDKAPEILSQMQARAKKLWDDRTLTTDEYSIIHEVCQNAYDRRRSQTEPDLKQKYDEAMAAKVQVELRKIQPQPDQLAVDLQNIPPNPNPVEVEDIPNQPQPDDTE